MDLVMIEKTKEIVDEINKLRSKVFCGEEIDRNEAINLVISLFRTFFDGSINDGIIASMLFGEFSQLGSILDRLIYKGSGIVSFLGENGSYNIMYDGKVVFERSKWRENWVNLLDSEDSYVSDYYFDANKLGVEFSTDSDNKRTVIYEYDEDGLVKRRESHESYVTGESSYFKEYEISRKITIMRDLVNPTLVHIEDGLYVLNGNSLMFKKEDGFTKFLDFSSYFDLNPTSGFSEVQFHDILYCVHCYNSAFRSDRDLACFFPQIKESFINRVKNVPDISYKRKRTKFNRFKNRNNEE